VKYSSDEGSPAHLRRFNHQKNIHYRGEISERAASAAALEVVRDRRVEASPEENSFDARVEEQEEIRRERSRTPRAVNQGMSAFPFSVFQF